MQSFCNKLATSTLLSFVQYLTNTHLSHLSILDQRTQCLIPHRPLAKLLRVLLHQQITYHPCKHHLTPRIQMCAIIPRRTVLTPVIRVRALLSNRIHIRRRCLVQIYDMQVVGLGYIECNGCFVRQVLDDAVRCNVKSATREGGEENGRCACLFDFGCEGREVCAVVC